jgi:uncharacterized protein YecE (DUF72 family)
VGTEPAVWVGTSGYSFRDWVGPFYPPGTKSGDFLHYYAARFSCVEVNSTYYGIPEPRVLQQMERKTPDGFRFIVKLNQEMTHGRKSDVALVEKFLRAIQPLKDAGKYHGLLAQFPWAFRRDESAKAHLERLRERLPGEPLWIEFRHASWMHPKLPDWLAERELGYCAVDEPALPGLVPPVTHVTNGIGYVRFHGRNAANWWASGSGAGEAVAPAEPGRAADSDPRLPLVPEASVPPPARPPRGDRYDYDYPERELSEWLDRVNALARQAKQTYLFFNNCHAGQAARNAKLMEELLRRSGTAVGAARP